jgi:membrane protein DedA with SNARE-associated domain
VLEPLIDIAVQVCSLATALPVVPPEAAQAATSATTDVAPHLEGMPDWFIRLLPYGTIAVFVSLAISGIGIHLSEDFVLIPAGFFVALGKLPMLETLLAAYFGLIVGDILWIALCRRYGTRMVHTRWFKRIVHPRRLLEAKHQMERRGVVVVILARFIPGTRTPVLTMAGLLHMPWVKFLPVEIVTAMVTVPLQLGIGYLAGRGVGKATSFGELVLWFLALIAATIAVMLVIHWWLQARRAATKPPRSKASWLRTFGRKRAQAAAATPRP